jgi:hypothetical protein
MMIRVGANEILVIPETAENEPVRARITAMIRGGGRGRGGNVSDAAFSADAFTLSAVDVRTYSRFHAGKMQRFARARFRVFLMLLLLLLGLEYLLVTDKQDAWLLIGVTALMMLLLVLLTRVLTRRQYEFRLQDLVGRKYELSVTEDGIRTRSPRGESFFRFAELQDLVDHGDYWYVYPNTLSALIVPKSALTEGAARELLARQADAARIRHTPQTRVLR